MLNVNTIEFGGRKAIINSFSDHPALVQSMNEQRESFAARFPNATVKTERMEEIDIITSIASQDRNAYWEIGAESNVK